MIDKKLIKKIIGGEILRKSICTSLFNLSIVAISAIIIHFVFKFSTLINFYYAIAIKLLFGLLGFLLCAKLMLFLLKKLKVSKIDYLLCIYFLMVWLIDVFSNNNSLAYLNYIYLGILVVFLREIFGKNFHFHRFYFNPTLLFVASFLFLILVGTLLLLHPDATIGAPLTIVDAIFMSTSAVCITGLSVVDVSVRLSDFGQLILLILIQVGGLGILTFTGFFGYFFSAGFSFKTQIMYTELLSENKLASVINSLLKIIFITFLIETIGAALLYFTLNDSDFSSNSQKLFFSIFHSVSAFCNAGFSILPDGLNHLSIRFNYSFQFIIAILFIIGGLGFGIVLNSYQFVKRWVINFYKIIVFKKAFIYKAWVISFNARLVVVTTFVLLVIGTGGFLILEYNKSLAAHSGFWAKLISAFFMGASPRTAGFNNVDMSALSVPAILLIMFLMWVGASPGSTGGGIKTSTFAVAILNFISLAKGKDRVEVFRREIGMDSVRRSSSIIFLSIITLSFTLFALSVSDGGENLLYLAFESFSAFSTVGLSLGITPNLSDAGRIILAITMFVGRVGTLTFIIAFIKKTSFKSYRYPDEKVLF